MTDWPRMTWGQSGHLQACYTKNIIQTDETHLNCAAWQINHKLITVGPYKYKGFE